MVAWCEEWDLLVDQERTAEATTDEEVGVIYVAVHVEV